MSNNQFKKFDIKNIMSRTCNKNIIVRNHNRNNFIMNMKEKINEQNPNSEDIKLVFKKKLEEMRRKTYKSYYIKMDKIKLDFYNIPVDVILYKILVFYPYNCCLFTRDKRKYDLFGYFKWDNSRKIHLIFRSIIEHHTNYLYININEIYSYNGTYIDLNNTSKHCKLTQLRFIYNHYVNKHTKDKKKCITINYKTLNVLKEIHIRYNTYFDIQNCIFPNLKEIKCDNIYINNVHPLLCHNHIPKIEDIKLNISYFSSKKQIYIKQCHIYEDNFMNLKRLSIKKIQDKKNNILVFLSQYKFPKLENLTLIYTDRSIKFPICTFNEFPKLSYFNINFKYIINSFELYKTLFDVQTFKNLEHVIIGYNIEDLEDLDKLENEICKLFPIGIKYIQIIPYVNALRWHQNGKLERKLCTNSRTIEKNIKRRLKIKDLCKIKL